MRKNGILLHISSLPSPYGIGKLGKYARKFVDFLYAAGVTDWQVLPLTPTSYGDSPYQSFSVHAGNPYFIDFETLEEEGLLLPSEYQNVSFGDDPRRVNYARLYRNCYPVLRTAATRFLDTPEYTEFCRENESWLSDYALFMALKDANAGKPWNAWPRGLRERRPKALSAARKTYAADIRFYQIVQFWFDRQWNDLRDYCTKKHISLIGDMPIYAAFDSADVWANPELFQLSDNLLPTAVAGCPPDIFSPTGQLWGNPLYDWNFHKKTGYSWWIFRLELAAKRYDTVRIDHFRGFESFYSVPYGNKTAEIGEWVKGPGMDLFRAMQEKLGDVSVIAEDLGFMTLEVKHLLAETGYPGMKVMQFAFDGDAGNDFLPHNYTTTNCVAYTGTHDNMTLRGWVETAGKREISFARHYLNCPDNDALPAAVLRCAWGSVAHLAVAQMQDFIASGAEDRMNTPSTLGDNWQFRLPADVLSPGLARGIRRINALYNRLPQEKRYYPRRDNSPQTFRFRPKQERKDVSHDKV